MLRRGFKDQIYDVYRYLPPEPQVNTYTPPSAQRKEKKRIYKMLFYFIFLLLAFVLLGWMLCCMQTPVLLSFEKSLFLLFLYYIIMSIM